MGDGGKSPRFSQKDQEPFLYSTPSCSAKSSLTEVNARDKSSLLLSATFAHSLYSLRDARVRTFVHELRPASNIFEGDELLTHSPLPEKAEQTGFSARKGNCLAAMVVKTENSSIALTPAFASVVAVAFALPKTVSSERGYAVNRFIVLALWRSHVKLGLLEAVASQERRADANAENWRQCGAATVFTDLRHGERLSPLIQGVSSVIQRRGGRGGGDRQVNTSSNTTRRRKRRVKEKKTTRAKGPP
ncbi:hypothetical protein TRVL_07569 [Trypanosoma vivax]|nr:hypothetical protein TRVL_07569 [Trypanosoma vivax]